MGALTEIVVGYVLPQTTLTHCVPWPEIIVDPGEGVQVIGPTQGTVIQYSAVSPAHKHWLIHSLGTINKGLPATTVIMAN